MRGKYELLPLLLLLMLLPLLLLNVVTLSVIKEKMRKLKQAHEHSGSSIGLYVSHYHQQTRCGAF
jgi:hypothetical protein